MLIAFFLAGGAGVVQAFLEGHPALVAFTGHSREPGAAEGCALFPGSGERESSSATEAPFRPGRGGYQHTMEQTNVTPGCQFGFQRSQKVKGKIDSYVYSRF